MAPFFSQSFRLRRGSSLVVLLAVFSSLAAGSSDPVAKYIDDLKSGPVVYYSPAAAAHFATLGGYSISGLSADKDAAVRAYMAAIKLGGMPLGSAGEAVSALIDVFPKAVHVVDVKQGRYAGEGTLEDCISTYVMSAKNQFMLSSPFLDYNLLSLCENFIDARYETEMLSKSAGSSRAVAEAVFNLKITFTYYAGECALSRLTGMGLGHDPSAWRQWWLTSGGASGMTPAVSPSFYSSAPAAVYAPASPQKDYSDIQVGGKYRVFLTTGDDLTGTVESRTDTSMVLETTDGKPYAFRFTLMQSYQVIQPPAPKPRPAAAPTPSGAEVVSYDELRLRSGSNPGIEVKIANGSLFKGTLDGITDDGLKINIEGSTIPIAKDVIKQIIALPPETPAVPVKKAQGPYDTLWIKNAQTDNYGNQKPDLRYIGSIIDEGDNYVSLKDTRGGAPQKFTRTDISRYIRHSAGGAADSIALYAKPLTCPAGMFLVDMPPGVADKPFFKVCVDTYEYPNKSGAMPQGKVSFAEAKAFCARQGKRLCTSAEWKWACAGKDGLMYPYGNTFDHNRCNSSRQIEASGGKINCASPFGGFDMVGNIFEWVTEKGEPALMGGPFSKCQTVSSGENGDAKPQLGFRCCKSN